MASDESRIVIQPEKDVPVHRLGAAGFFDPLFIGEEAASESDFGSSIVRMRRQMAEMERQMDRMFEHLFRLEPISARSMRSATGRVPSWWEDDSMDNSFLGWRRGPRGVWETDIALPAPSQHQAQIQAPTSPLNPTSPQPHSENSLMIRQTSRDQDPREFGAPVVVDQAEQRKLRMRFDVRQFKPEEIQVKTHDNKVMVKAVHKEESDSNQVFCEYQRMFTMPPEAKPDTLTSSLSPDGVLTLEAPMPSLAVEEAPKDINIPITHE